LQGSRRSLAYIAAAILVAGVLVSATLILIPMLRLPTTVTETSSTSPETYTACLDQPIFGPCAGGDIVNGPVTINASQYSLYEFDIPYGAQDIAVHLQWSSGGAIGVYVMNATELIGWQNGHGLRTFYNSGQAKQGDLNLMVPPDDLYYLVFDNSLSSAAKNVQGTSGVSYMCDFCSTAPIQQLSSSAAACIAVNGSEACSVALSNLGNETASPTGTCIESWGAVEGPVLTWGAPHLGVFTPRTAISPSSSLSGTCTVTGFTAPLELAIIVQIPFTDGDNVDLYGPASLNTVVATITVTETLTTQASQATTTYAIPTTSCTFLGPDVTTTVTIIVGPALPASTTTTTTTVTTTSTSYTQTVTVTSCTYSMPTTTSVTTIVTR
jgi:hypothetical protein